MKKSWRQPFSELKDMNYGRWVINSDCGLNKRGQRLVECKCTCGVVRVVLLASLKSGKSISCGCYRKEKTSASNMKHGLSQGRNRLYSIWKAMKTRCYNKTIKQYCDYGGRGIEVCSEWLNDFSVFHDWAINNGYEEGLDIDREDNDKNYTPDNCRFRTKKQNNRNRRSNNRITFMGETKILIEWCEFYGLHFNTAKHRINLGWSIEDTFTKPVRKRTV